MKAEATYNGLSLEWYTMGSRNQHITFEVTGTDIYENYYDVTVEAYLNENGIVEMPDMDSTVENVITNLSPYTKYIF